MDVQYLHRVVRCLVEHLVGIPDEGHDTHPRSLGYFLRALGPFAYPREDGTKPNLKRLGYGRLVNSDVCKNPVEIIERLDGKNHLHAGRCFSKTCLT